MKRNKKITSLGFSGLLTVILMLSMTVGALAAAQDFSVVGKLVAVDADTWSVQGVEFDVNTETLCFASDGSALDCTTIVAGVLVEVAGTFDDEAEPIVRTATSITLLVGDETFSYTGAVDEITTDYWIVDGFKFWITEDTILPVDFFGANDTVNVLYALSTDPATLGEYLALEITVIDSALSYPFSGILEAASGESWTVDGISYIVPAGIQPPFFAEGDEVAGFFSIVGGNFVVDEVAVVNSGEGNYYTFTGTLSLSADKTIWTVTDSHGTSYDFYVPAELWPVYFGEQDIVEITFHIEERAFVVDAVEVLKTYVPTKTESNRCMNRMKEHPAILKLAYEVRAAPEELTALFCKGFGIGEIKLAYRYAQGSEYTPEMLLALRAQGYSWGDLKKLAKGAPLPEDGETEEGETVKMNPSQGKAPKSESALKPAKPVKQDNPNKPNQPGKPDKPDKPEKPEKPEKPAKPDKPGKP
jgi:hypothetical protein